ncbi:hypothetical protein OG611_08955 [Streptomyces sp. NBC_01363]|nr:hypothetical protein [Streptomyces sp. NBC_01363]
MAAPARADNDSNFASGVNAADNWDFTESATCLQEVTAVPVVGGWVGDHTNNWTCRLRRNRRVGPVGGVRLSGLITVVRGALCVWGV